MSERKDYKCPRCNKWHYGRGWHDFAVNSDQSYICDYCEKSSPITEWAAAINPTPSESEEFQAGEKFTPDQEDDIEVSLNGKDWMDTPYEFLALNAKGDYMCWTDNKIGVERWPFAREIQPKEVQPDYLDSLPPDCEVFECIPSCDGIITFEQNEDCQFHMNVIRQSFRFRGFLHKNADGKFIVSPLYPMWISKGGNIVSVYIEGDELAELIGCVMLKDAK